MKRPYLIQRLQAPMTQENPFSFGGGKVNGGLSPEAMKLLKSIFSFDYMGSAEFEWGALPKAFESLAKADLVATKEGEVFILCPKAIESDVKEWIKLASEDKHEHLKEHLGLKQAINKEKYSSNLGWIKIEEDKYCDEPFMFFVDGNMFEQTCKLFGVNIFQTS